MLTFRLDFNEYYTDKFYQASEFDFKSSSMQEEYKSSNVSLSADQPIVIEEIKTKPDKRTLGIPPAPAPPVEVRQVTPLARTDEKKMIAKKSSVTKILQPQNKEGSEGSGSLSKKSSKDLTIKKASEVKKDN
jgi:hypothetical protein